MPHTRTRPGMRVYVELRDGECFIDHFVQRTPSKLVVFRRRSVRAGDIAVFRQATPTER